MMGFFNSAIPQPAEVSKHTVHVCLSAIAAVAVAYFLGAVLEGLQELLFLHKSGEGMFHFDTFTDLFWIGARYVLVIVGAGLLGYLIFKGSRDAAVAGAGFCLALVALGIVPFFRTIFHFADSAASVVIALRSLLLLATPAAALVVLIFLLHRWPAQSKPAA
jgi:hypothetical protein